MNSPRKNRLSLETSAYLLQHALNPVDWFPWGNEALTQAKKENKPIFLSIGYSACHWCHVMEKESFEDPETAEILRKFFISIKVDREERPDLDHIYMAAVQALTHRGGWPLTVFLTPELKPFYGGTYFPPQDRFGMPSFKKLLLGIANAWKTKPDDLKSSAEELTRTLAQMTEMGALTPDKASKASLPEPSLLCAKASSEILARFDSEFGGLGSAPKFFHTMDWRVVLRHWKNSGSSEGLDAVKTTLDHWARGGIFDHLGGGFHRYSTDKEWLVPHFEKMLYDNALVPQLYLEAFQATHNIDFARVARETLDYIIREMTSPLGGYFSTEDADSEGVEGKFYVWSQEEIQELLDSDSAALFCEVFGVSSKGNWEGSTILNLPKSLEKIAKEKEIEVSWLEGSLARAKRKLLQKRRERIKPGKDEKIILGWNGLMIETMAKAHQALNDETYLDSAKACASFVFDFLKQQQSTALHHSFQDGKPRFNAYLDDYSYFINGLISLFESEFDLRWLNWAEELANHVLKEFWDNTSSSFFYTPKHHESLIYRPKEYQDGALPSPTGMMVTALVRLGKISGKLDFIEKAEQVLKTYSNFIEKAPLATGQFLIAWELMKNKSKEVVLVPGEDGKEEEFLSALRSEYHPNLSILVKSQSNQEHPLLKNRDSKNGKTTIYICEDQSCLEPVTDLKQMKELLDE